MTTQHKDAQSTAGPPQAQPLHFTVPASHRFVFLDALRGLAAILVVLFHLPLRRILTRRYHAYNAKPAPLAA